MRPSVSKAACAHNPFRGHRKALAVVAHAFSVLLLGWSMLTYAQVKAPTIRELPGRPTLMLGSFDLGQLGYQSEEFLLSGSASSYRLTQPPGTDGKWEAAPDQDAPYQTRVVVVRPKDPARFNGMVLVEWLNVTAGQDTPADWMVTHREMLRRGYAYVAVSAQRVGVEGGAAAMPGAPGASLKKTDPARYGALVHPGDAWSYDIYSQAGAAIKMARAGGLLGQLAPRTVVAIGESQSAAYLVTYVNAVDPLARVYDGFFVHSRFGGASGIDGTAMSAGRGGPAYVKFRPGLRVPVLTLITETDLLGGGIPGYAGARQPDNAHLRVWELAGAAHADAYQFGGAMVDSGLLSTAELARVFIPASGLPGFHLAKPYNAGMPHHYVAEAALAALSAWLETGKAPVSTELLQLTPNSPTTGANIALAVDANGLALGGIRTPWVDVPTMRLAGYGNSGGFLAALAGVGEPFDTGKLNTLYPRGKPEYLQRFTAALDRAIAAGHLLPEDRQEILDIAAINFDVGARPVP
jgi:Alpha/beta hydrolase domain